MEILFFYFWQQFTFPMSNRFKTLPHNKTVQIVQELHQTPQGPKVEHVHQKPKPLKKNRKRQSLTLEDTTGNKALPGSQPLNNEAGIIPGLQELQPEEDWHGIEDEDQGFNNIFLSSSKKTKV